MQYVSTIDQHITHISSLTHAHAKANILIIHGMAEHRFRYEAFMTQLFEENYNVFALDLRGHGESLIDGLQGYFGDKPGYLSNIEDIHGIIKMIKNQYPLKMVLFGHSMGSLFSRAYLKMYPGTLDALILSGSPYPPFGTQALKQIIRIPAYFSPKAKSKLIYKFMNYNFNKEIEHKKTDLDWLSFDENNIASYIQDPLANFPFTLSAYVDLFNLMKLVYNDKWERIETDLPILFVVGRHDPCVDFKHDGLSKAIQKLNDAGFHNIKDIIYENSRHELLNDVQKQEVTLDIIAYLKGLKL